MNELQDLKKRMDTIDFRLRVLEKYLDDVFGGIYKGETSDVNAIKATVFHQMKQEIKDLQLDFNKQLGRDFYSKKG